MNATEVLKCFLHFFEKILPKAFCSPDFSEDSIANAFLWAETCEKIHEGLGEENAKELKELLQSSKFAKDHNLRQCTSILCHAFLQNPNLDRNHFENILLKIKPCGLNSHEIWKDAEELESLCMNLLESLKSIRMMDSDRSFYYEVKSELLLDFLRDFTEQLGTEEQLETRLSHVLETLCKSHDGMIVLLHALLCHVEEVSEIQEFAIHWILSKFLEDRNSPLASFFWRQDPHSLKKIAIRHPAFYSYYVNYLTQSAATLHPVFENGTEQWERRMTSNAELLSYSVLVQHFRTLTATEDAVNESTRDHLITLTNQQDSMIWKDIMYRIGLSSD